MRPGTHRLRHQHGIDAASFSAIGGFERTRLGFFNLETRGFDEIAFHEEQVEVLSLTGDILTSDDHVLTVHGHVVVGRRDGATAGGHLLEGLIQPILIVTLVELQPMSCTTTTSPTDTGAQHERRPRTGPARITACLREVDAPCGCSATWT